MEAKKMRARAGDFPSMAYKALVGMLFFVAVMMFLLGYTLHEVFLVKAGFEEFGKSGAFHKAEVLKEPLRIGGFLFLVVGCAMLFFREKMIGAIGRHKKPIQNALVLGLTICIMIALLEVGLRAALPEEWKYSLAPGQLEFDKKYVDYNKEGYRDIDHDLKKKAGTTRIIALGDSFTFGHGIKNVNDTYAVKLGKMLNDNNKGKKFEVITIAKRGYGTANEIKALKEDGLKYDPDVVVLGYVLNDFVDSDNVPTEKTGNKYVHMVNNYLYDGSYVYNFYDQGMARLKEYMGLNEPYRDFLVRAFGSESNKDFNREYFEELKTLSKEHDFELVVVVFPLVYNLEEYPFMNAHEYMRQLGGEVGFETIDLLSDYQKEDEKALVVSVYDYHPSELGNTIASRKIYEYFKERFNLTAKNQDIV